MLCRSDALLINTCRGGVVDSDALATALSTGEIGGAGLDVTAVEPIPENSLLLRAPNCLITPHIAGDAAQR